MKRKAAQKRIISIYGVQGLDLEDANDVQND